jgi:2-(1,2-epoxy-1,2-dihydrophenyl)acetyl-CoA isomerase
VSDEEPVRCAVDGPVATVTLDRPHGRNAMTTKMVKDAYDVLWRLSGRDDVRVVVLTGSDVGFFCPGADLAGDPSLAETPEPWELRVPVLLHEMPPVTIAAVNGACAGAGLGWACACDLRIAASSARFSTAFLDVGVAGDMGLPWTLSRIVGPARARELEFLTGKFDAQEALRIGLVSAVHDDAVFRDEVAAAVERLAAAAPNALRTLKANFVASERMGLPDFVDLETERHLRLVAGPEFREGTRAFAERRPPRFD